MAHEQTYQGPKVVPDFGDVRIQPNGPGICVESVAVLVDLIVEYADRAPECRVPAVAIDRLLVGFICFGELLLGHVAATEQVPALSVLIVCASVRQHSAPACLVAVRTRAH